MSGLDHAMARGRSESSTALGVLCLLGIAMLALTLLTPMMWQRYGNEGLVPAIMVSGLVAIAATKVSANASAYWGLIAILAFAVALRIVALAHEPFFSTDIYRYIWDGRVQAAGINPYRYVPADPALAALRDAAIFPHINRADYAPTIYPPVAQMFFLAVTRLGETLTVMRLALVGCEVATVAIMIDLLRRLGLPATAVVAYAWHPLAVWEIANNGHVDSLMVALLMLGIWFFVRARPLASGVAIAVAALVKPYVVIVLAALWRRWDWRLPLAVAGTLFLGYLPYLGVGKGVFGYLAAGYVTEEGMAAGNGFWLVLVLRRVLGDIPGLVPLYLAVALGVLGWLALRAAMRPERTPIQVIRDMAALLMAALFFLSTSYPWYFLVLVPLIPFIGGAPMWILTVGSFVLYPLWPDTYDAHYLIWKGAFSIAFLIAVVWSLTMRAREGSQNKDTSAWAS